MTLHPKFDKDSSCENCAAFYPDGSLGEGECHRHAPRPMVVTCAQEDDGNEIDHRFQSRLMGAAWPRITDVFFCCEWLPKPESKSALPTIDQLLARSELTARARTALHRAYQLGEQTTIPYEECLRHEGRWLRNVGDVNAASIAKAIDAWRAEQ